MTRKLFAGTLALAILLAGAIVAPRLLNSPLQGAVTGQMAADGQTGADRQRREAALQAAILEQRHEQDRKVAVARQAEQDRLRQEAEEQARALKQVEEERIVADAFDWAVRYQQRREATEKEAARKQQEAVAWAEGQRESEQDRQQREAAEALARKHRQDEARMIADVRAKAEGVLLALKGSGPSTQATGTVKTCENCGPDASARQTKAKARPGRNVAHALPGRARPVRTANAGCPVLAWLQGGY